MKINYKIFWVFLFIIAVGICTGSFFETGMTDGSKSGFFDALISFFHVAEAGGGDGENFSSENFLSALGSFLPVLLIGYVSAFLPILLPLIPLYIFTRGVSVGFSAAAILEAFGLKGTAYILITLMPPHFIQLHTFLSNRPCDAFLSVFKPSKIRCFTQRQKSFAVRYTKVLHILFCRGRFNRYFLPASSFPSSSRFLTVIMAMIVFAS